MNLLLDLPSEIAIIILSQYCDGKSLSTLLITFASSTTHRQLIPCIISSLQKRVEHLQKQNLIPPVGKSATSRWPHLNFVDLLSSSSCCNDFDVSTWPGLISRIQPISERLAVLSFLEDLHLQLSTTSLSPTNNQNPNNNNEEEESKKEKLVEYPLWCGTITMDCNYYNGRSESTIETANVIATTPSTTWHHVLVSEWSKFSSCNNNNNNKGEKKRRVLKPTPRRATPLPPLARLRGVTTKDSFSLTKMASRLRELDEVASMGGGDGYGGVPISYMRRRRRRSEEKGGSPMMLMSVLLMSRKQAIKRLCLRRPRNMWPLDYECTTKEKTLGEGSNSIDGDGGERINNVSNCYHILQKIEVAENAREEEEEEENHYHSSSLERQHDFVNDGNDTDRNDELFAFMDGPYIGFDYDDENDNGGDSSSSLPDFSTVVDDLIYVMNTYYSYVSSSSSSSATDAVTSGSIAAATTTATTTMTATK